MSFRERDDVQSLVEKLAKDGASTSEIEKSLRKEFGKAYRRQNLQEDIRRYTKKPKKKDTEKYTPKKYRYTWVDDNKRMPYRYDKNYNHFVGYQVKENKTKEIFDKYIVISTNKVLTPSQIVKRAKEILSENEENYKNTEKIVPGSIKYLYSIFEKNPRREGEERY